ncbi:hypothetical protein L1887_11553 [Cichorium endivia]|nr:hypothetical protein L1887_11553 [Cichorium endivia]
MDVMISAVETGGLTDYDADAVIKSTCLDIIASSTDTITVTLTWALSLLLNNPFALQKKMLVVGGGSEVFQRLEVVVQVVVLALEFEGLKNSQQNEKWERIWVERKERETCLGERERTSRMEGDQEVTHGGG